MQTLTSLSTRETVAPETPARSATCLNEVRKSLLSYSNTARASVPQPVAIKELVQIMTINGGIVKPVHVSWLKPKRACLHQ